jgi:hypothetical protein
MQKLIRVVDDDTKTLDTYLNNGWVIKQISCCYCDRSLNDSVCYVLIESINNG